MWITRLSIVVVGVSCLLGIAAQGPLQAGDKDKGKPVGKKVELRGTIKTGIFAFGGETTGTIIETKDGTYELAVSKELRKDVDNLDKKLAVVTGTIAIRKGIEVKERKIVTVETVKSADNP